MVQQERFTGPALLDGRSTRRRSMHYGPLDHASQRLIRSKSQEEARSTSGLQIHGTPSFSISVMVCSCAPFGEVRANAASATTLLPDSQLRLATTAISKVGWNSSTKDPFIATGHAGILAITTGGVFAMCASLQS